MCPIAVVSPTLQLFSFLLRGALWLPGRSCCDLLISARSRPALHSHYGFLVVPFLSTIFLWLVIPH